MAIYDHRVFRKESEWWVAQVHSAFGGGWVAEGTRPNITGERILFTCVTDSEQRSRSINIAPNMLNRLSHRAILDLLERASTIESRFTMGPYNHPESISYDESQVVQDNEGLRWAIEDTVIDTHTASGPGQCPALKFRCLDDSALVGIVVLEGPANSLNALSDANPAVVPELIESIKKKYSDEVRVRV